MALLEKAKGLPKTNYMELQKFHTDYQQNNPELSGGSVVNDYANIDTSLPECKQFRSVFYEWPRKGPVKECICNDKVIYTNMFCQCQPCRNKKSAENK
jgi:hypothetical protein